MEILPIDLLLSFVPKNILSRNILENMKFYFLLKLRTCKRRKVFYFLRRYRYILVIVIMTE